MFRLLKYVVLFISISKFAEATEFSFNTPLCDAVKEKDVKKVKELLESGVDPNANCNFLGFSFPLFITAKNGTADIALMLVKAHANIEAVNSLGYTATLEAAESLHYEVLNVLLENGGSLSVEVMTANLLTSAANGYLESYPFLNAAERVRALRNFKGTVDVLYENCFDIQADGEVARKRLAAVKLTDGAKYIAITGGKALPAKCPKQQ